MAQYMIHPNNLTLLLQQYLLLNYKHFVSSLISCYLQYVLFLVGLLYNLVIIFIFCKSPNEIIWINEHAAIGRFPVSNNSLL